MARLVVSFPDGGEVSEDIREGEPAFRQVERLLLALQWRDPQDCTWEVKP